MKIADSIVVTLGDPAGIGPDIFLKVLQTSVTQRLTVIADRELLLARAKQLIIPETVLTKCNIIHVPLVTACVAGKPDAKNASYILETLRLAVEGCLQQQFKALVTGPIHKATINAAGIAFTGHTGFIAKLCQVAQPVMMLMSNHLKVALLTDHIPLSQVASAITFEKIINVVKIIHQDLPRYFAIERPRIIVCGLNPHAGENGYLGQEEQLTLIPAIKKLQTENINIVGPAAADTVFTAAILRKADIILAMYHDQGLPVIKAQSFGRAVNVTLGLPIIRTSVDHGTAFDKAGTGAADEGSLLAAIAVAAQMENSHLKV